MRIGNHGKQLLSNIHNQYCKGLPSWLYLLEDKYATIEQVERGQSVRESILKKALESGKSRYEPVSTCRGEFITAAEIESMMNKTKLTIRDKQLLVKYSWAILQGNNDEATQKLVCKILSKITIEDLTNIESELNVTPASYTDVTFYKPVKNSAISQLQKIVFDLLRYDDSVEFAYSKMQTGSTDLHTEFVSSGDSYDIVITNEATKEYLNQLASEIKSWYANLVKLLSNGIVTVDQLEDARKNMTQITYSRATINESLVLTYNAFPPFVTIPNVSILHFDYSAIERVLDEVESFIASTIRNLQFNFDDKRLDANIIHAINREYRKNYQTIHNYDGKSLIIPAYVSIIRNLFIAGNDCHNTYIYNNLNQILLYLVNITGSYRKQKSRDDRRPSLNRALSIEHCQLLANILRAIPYIDNHMKAIQHELTTANSQKAYTWDQIDTITHFGLPSAFYQDRGIDCIKLDGNERVAIQCKSGVVNYENLVGTYCLAKLIGATIEIYTLSKHPRINKYVTSDEFENKQQNTMPLGYALSDYKDTIPNFIATYSEFLGWVNQSDIHTLVTTVVGSNKTLSCLPWVITILCILAVVIIIVVLVITIQIASISSYHFG